MIPDPRAARSLRFSPSVSLIQLVVLSFASLEDAARDGPCAHGKRFARTVDGYHPSTVKLCNVQKLNDLPIYLQPSRAAREIQLYIWDLALTRALRARRARPPEVPEKGSMKEPQVHPYIGCTFGGIEVFRAARACAVISLC